MSDQAGAAEENFDPPRPFLEHLMALRSCLVGAAVSWVICCLVAGVFSPAIIEWMQSPVSKYEAAKAIEAENSSAAWSDAVLAAAAADARLIAKEETAELAAALAGGVPAAEDGSGAGGVAEFRKKMDESLAKAREDAAKAKETVKAASERLQDAESKRVTIQGFKVTSGFTLILEAALWGGTVLAFPFFLYYILKFIFPALRDSERRVIMCCLALGSFFFLGGIWVAYSQTLPLAVDVLMGFSDWIGLSVRIVEVSDLFSLVLKALVAFGLVFQLPLIIFTLGWLGVVTSATLRKFRRFAIVIAFFFGMVLTPPDPMSQLVMALPLCIFYEICIWLIRLREIFREKKEKEGAGAAK